MPGSFVIDGKRLPRTMGTVERLKRSFRVESETGCWLWLGNLWSKKPGLDYGSFWIPQLKRKEKAHRIMFSFRYGQIPKELCVLHKCDRPRCVNPRHLFLGTRLDNNRDMIRKNRHHKLGVGVNHALAKFNELDILEIRRLRKTGLIYKAIAAKFNCHLSTIAYICTGVHYAQ